MVFQMTCLLSINKKAATAIFNLFFLANVFVIGFLIVLLYVRMNFIALLFFCLACFDYLLF